MADQPTDSEMLDWLERSQESCGTWWSTDGEGFPEGYFATLDEAVHRAPTLRAAIAAAMSASSQPEPDTQ